MNSKREKALLGWGPGREGGWDWGDVGDILTIRAWGGFGGADATLSG